MTNYVLSSLGLGKKKKLHPDFLVSLLLQLEKTFRTGAKEIRFPNGTVKEISADGQTIVCRLANGDIRQILPDHRVVSSGSLRSALFLRRL